jgi:hypothetical protein
MDLVDESAAAAALGCSVRRLASARLREGAPAVRDGRHWRYDLAEVRAWADARGVDLGARPGRPRAIVALRRELLLEGLPDLADARGVDLADARGPPEGPPVGASGPPEETDSLSVLSLKEAYGRAVATWWRASRERLATERARGELVLRADVVAAYAQATARARDALEALPAILSSELAACGSAREIDDRLSDAIRKALSALALSAD